MRSVHTAHRRARQGG